MRTRTLDILVVAAWLCMMVSAYLVTDTPCSQIVIDGTMMLLLYGIIRMLPSTGNLALSILVIWAAYEVVIGVLQMAGIQRSNHLLYSLTGTFDNPGPYGGFLAVVFSIFMSEHINTGRKVWLAVALVCLCVLPATWSRAAWLAVAVSMACLFWRKHKRLVMCGIVLILIIAVPLYFLKQASADGRLFMAYISGKSVINHLWTGSGVGSYLSAYGSEMTSFFKTTDDMDVWIDVAEVPGNSFCEMLKIGVEQGVVGMVIWISIAVCVFFLLWQRKSPMLYGLIALIVFSCFSYPSDIWEFRMLFVMMACGLTNGGVPSVRKMKLCVIKKNIIKNYIKSHTFTRLVFCFLCIFAEILLVMYNINRNELKESYSQMTGVTDEAFLDDYYELMPVMKDNANFLFDYAQALRKAERWNESNAVLRRGLKVSADPMFTILQGNNYRSMHFYDLADSAYKAAYCRLPNRMYPLYCRMTLYKECGQKQNMMRLARQIIAFTPKRESPATVSMREEAKEILNTNQHESKSIEY